jgi:flagellar biosynthetic protein FliR
VNQTLSDLLGISSNFLWIGFVVFLRIAAAIALMPAFGESTVPVRVKLAITFAFVMVVAPAVSPRLESVEMANFQILIFTETLAGLLLGLGVRLFILALQTAGSIAAQSTSLSQILGGAAADPLPAMGYILIISALALATMTGLHVKAVALIILSYEMLPIGQFPTGTAIANWGTAQISSAFALAFTLAAPFITLSVIYNLSLGVINKAMPQLMVAFVGAPVITAGGLFILLLAAPFMLETWLASFDQFFSSPFRVSR